FLLTMAARASNSVCATDCDQPATRIPSRPVRVDTRWVLPPASIPLAPLSNARSTSDPGSAHRSGSLRQKMTVRQPRLLHRLKNRSLPWGCSSSWHRACRCYSHHEWLLMTTSQIPPADPGPGALGGTNPARIRPWRGAALLLQPCWRELAAPPPIGASSARSLD